MKACAQKCVKKMKRIISTIYTEKVPAYIG